LYLATDVRAMTPRPLILDAEDMSSSVIPSAKYSSRESELILSKGRIAIR